MKGMTQLTKVKQNIYQHKDKSCNLKNTKQQTQGPTGLCTVYVKGLYDCNQKRKPTMCPTIWVLKTRAKVQQKQERRQEFCVQRE